ncbi:alpha-protein kinase 1 isoform X2 [Kryptolebias marmoratus]|uniref:alpha-protein kinase 1 isoform X2 n=1 Tax=Kryptolebias marmoratus TaxID=37003 RepID=UPI0018AD03EF|nr:alpha-protein kinase 1 isoform X2 [Kryptolebias marmoratus]
MEECLRAAAAAAAAVAAPHQAPQLTEEVRLNYCSCRDSLCAELASLLQEAVEMKWPFVPEKWQYKKSVSPDDKTNLSDLISKHLHQLLVLLEASIVAQEAPTALAVVFLVDRFIYWTDESSRLLKIAKLLHRRHPDTPIAPQLVIRQARVYFNSGKLQKAEYILSSLINNSGTTGRWSYQSDGDRALVQAVSVQVRGMILQKLGLWLQAAELIWASLVGFYSLPQPDKKGIGTSLCLLANILVSMDDEDFHVFRTNPDIDFSLLGNSSDRLLSAAHAAKMSVTYSQYTPLYVLTNVTTQGTCLLSYSFSLECPPPQRASFLQQAREAFAVGLLTKADSDLVTSQQELHTFLKAAYSITVAHKWLGAPQGVVTKAAQACQKALANFYDYSRAATQDKEELCAEIMRLVGQVKVLLGVDPFPNSDKGSFIPDSYRNVKDSSVNFTLEAFSKIMQRFQKYHASLCENTTRRCRGAEDEADGARLCLTALGTTADTLGTECRADVDQPQRKGSVPSSGHPPSDSDTCPTVESSDQLGSSWQRLSPSSSGSPRPPGHGANMSNQRCITTESDDGRSADENQKERPHGRDSSISSHAGPKSAASSSFSSKDPGDLEKFEVMQAELETVDTERDWMAIGVAQKQEAGAGGDLRSLSQLTLKTSSSSLGDSFSSQSSWEKIPSGKNSPACGKPQPSHLSKPETGQRSMSSDSNESFFILETEDSEPSLLDLDATKKNQWKVGAPSEPRPLENSNINSNMETEVDPEPVKPATSSSSAAQYNRSQPVPDQCGVTETSTDDSFQMLEVDENGLQLSELTSTENVPQRKNPLCHSCRSHSTAAAVAPVKQFLLSKQDYQALLAGVCQECLLTRLCSDKTQFKLNSNKTAYNALHLKFSKATGLWTAKETCVYIGESMGMKGNQREAIWVQFLHQEERLSSYVGKDYLQPRGVQFHLKDVERQMTAQYYVTEFNKRLYDKEVMAQIFFIPSEALLVLNGDEIVGCLTVEPYMLGDFVKLTNNTRKKNKMFRATEYGLAFGHFTYLFSGGQEVVVDLQGWVTASGKGLTYLTDPQIHSTRTPKGPGNFADRGLRLFLEEQHGPECNEICQLLKLHPVAKHG